MSARDNVLFIVIDQLRADCVFGALADHVDMPNIRALAQDAVYFENHHSVVNPCGPSRASLLTGQYAMNHRSVRNGTPLRHDAVTLASELRKMGRLPMLFGYTDTSGDPRAYHPTDPAVQTYEYPMVGFHEVVEMRLEMSYPWRSHLMNKGYEFDRYWDLYKPVPEGDAPAQINDPAIYRAEDSDTAFLTDQFLERIPAYADQPWFAHLTYIRPHPPLVAPAPYNQMYDPGSLPVPNGYGAKVALRKSHPFNAPLQDRGDPANNVVGIEAVADDLATVQTLRSVYLGLATEVDHHIGRVITFLKDTNQLENTLVVVTADHGEMLGDYHLWGKMTYHRAAYHTPMIIRAPGCQDVAGQVVSARTESIDVSPTILNWLGAEIPNAMDGRSVLPFLKGTPPENWRTHGYCELDFSEPLQPTIWQNELGLSTSEANLCVYSEDTFSLVQFAADLPPMLFDHANMAEEVDLAGDPDHAPRLADMTRKLLQHKMRNADHSLSLDVITSNGPARAKRWP
jgi:arylsulfatase A-like enzyme